MIVPLFPLNDAFLFPGALLTLHIFEPRYRQMVEDLLDQAGYLVIGAIETGNDEAEDPRCFPVAGMGEISGHHRLEDGRFLIALIGTGRVRISEVESERMYRKVRVEPLEEEPIPHHSDLPLRDELEEAVRSRARKLDIPSEVSTAVLVDLLLMQMYRQAELTSEVKAELFAEPAILDRAHAALREHRRQDPPGEAELGDGFFSEGM